MSILGSVLAITYVFFLVADGIRIFYLDAFPDATIISLKDFVDIVHQFVEFMTILLLSYRNVHSRQNLVLAVVFVATDIVTIVAIAAGAFTGVTAAGDFTTVATAGLTLIVDFFDRLHSQLET